MAKETIAALHIANTRGGSSFVDRALACMERRTQRWFQQISIAGLFDDTEEQSGLRPNLNKDRRILLDGSRPKKDVILPTGTSMIQACNLEQRALEPFSRSFGPQRKLRL